MAHKILLAAGGTGGHLFPAYAVALGLKAKGHDVYLMIDKRAASFQQEIEGVSVISMPMGPKAPGIGGILKFILSLLRSTFFALRTLLRLNPNVIVGFGGYPTFPLLVVSTFFSIPKILHEQNACLGRVNRWFVRDNTYLALSFPETKNVFQAAQSKTTIVGMPLRPPILALQSLPYTPPQKEGPFSLLILGGSQGTQIFGKVIPEALGLLPKALQKNLHVIHQVRAQHLDFVQKWYESMEINATVAPFFTAMETLLSQAHLVISRSGASSTWEVIVAKRPTLFIPLPSAKDDHQTYNAHYVVKSRGAWLMPQEELTSQKLSKFLEKLMENPDMLTAAAHCLEMLAPPNATDKLIDLIEHV